MKSPQELKERMADRAEKGAKAALIYKLRVQWEKDRYYGFFNDAKKVWRELMDLGYRAREEDTISIYGKR